MLVCASNHITIKIANVYKINIRIYIILNKVRKYVNSVLLAVYAKNMDVENAMLKRIELIKPVPVFFLVNRNQENVLPHAYFRIIWMIINANVQIKFNLIFII
jgi:hypothetical protein